MRVRPRPWLVESMPERARVAMNPEKIQLNQFIQLSRLRYHLMRFLLAGAFGSMSKLLLAFLPLHQRKCSANQSHVGESLGKIPKSLAGFGVDFLAVEPKIIFVFQQASDQRLTFLDCAATQCKILRFPEAADGKCAFLRVAVIAIKQSLASAKLAANRLIAGAHARGISLFESIPTHEEKTGVKLIAVEFAHVTLQFLVPTTAGDLALNGFAVLEILLEVDALQFTLLA